MDTTPNLHVTPKLPLSILITAFSNYSCNIHPPTQTGANLQIHNSHLDPPNLTEQKLFDLLIGL